MNTSDVVLVSCPKIRLAAPTQHPIFVSDLYQQQSSFMRFTVALVLYVLTVPPALAGQPLNTPIDTIGVQSSTIYLQYTFFGGPKYVKDGAFRSAGGSFGKLREALIEVPDAHDLAGVGSRIVTHGRLLSLLGTAIGVTTFFVHGEVANWSATIGGFLVAGAGGAIQMKGRNRINEAVWLYNQCMVQGAACIARDVE